MVKIEPIYRDGKKIGAKISDITLIKLIDDKPSLWSRIIEKCYTKFKYL